MGHRNAGTRGDVADAAEVARRDHVGPHTLDVRDLGVAEPARQVGLQYLVGAGPAAAEVALGHVLHDEARVAQQLLRQRVELLAVLHRAGRMVGDGERMRRHVAEADLGHDLGHIGQVPPPAWPSHARPIVGQHVAIVSP
jgi:hypothetical protein